MSEALYTILKVILVYIWASTRDFAVSHQRTMTAQSSMYGDLPEPSLLDTQIFVVDELRSLAQCSLAEYVNMSVYQRHCAYVRSTAILCTISIRVSEFFSLKILHVLRFHKKCIKNWCPA